MRNTRFSFLFATALPLLLLVASACGPTGGSGDDVGGDDDDTSNLDGGNGRPDAPVQQEFIDAGATEACDKIDILFVIDNSGSMQQEQANLATNFPMFASLIDTYVNSAGSTIDYHIGVIVTDKTYTTITEIIPGFPIMDTSDGHDGKLLELNGEGQSCNMPRRYLQRGDSNVTTILPCVANQGISGSANEMPLEVTRQALQDRIADGYNSGFLREDALLAIVILTDENDCSFSANPVTVDPFNTSGCDATPDPPANFVAAIDQVKGGQRGRWAVAVIAGETDCSSTFGNAEEATRLKEFTQMVGANAVFSSICAGDLAPALQTAFETFGEACEGFPPIE